MIPVTDKSIKIKRENISSIVFWNSLTINQGRDILSWKFQLFYLGGLRPMLLCVTWVRNKWKSWHLRGLRKKKVESQIKWQKTSFSSSNVKLDGFSFFSRFRISLLISHFESVSNTFLKFVFAALYLLGKQLIEYKFLKLLVTMTMTTVPEPPMFHKIVILNIQIFVKKFKTIITQ